MTLYLAHSSRMLLDALDTCFKPRMLVCKASEWAPLMPDLLGADPRTDLFVCGEKLSGTTGAELCRIVRRHKPGLKIVLLSDDPERVSDLGPGVDVVATGDALEVINAMALAIRARTGLSPTEVLSAQGPAHGIAPVPRGRLIQPRPGRSA